MGLSKGIEDPLQGLQCRSICDADVLSPRLHAIFAVRRTLLKLNFSLCSLKATTAS